MKPERLIISGWGPFKCREEIDFTQFDGRGLFLVTGATGAGKTTIFDAITYALYGNLSGERREKNSVRSDFAEPDTPTFVELLMQHGGREYRVKRNPEYCRPSKRAKNGMTKEKENAILWLPDGSATEGVREVNEKLRALLSLDYGQFKQLTMIAQGEFSRMLLASPREKTTIFRSIFGTEIYERFAQQLKARAQALYGEVQEQKNKLEEDVRLLLANEAEREALSALRELTDTPYWNYGKIGEELADLSAQAAAKEAALQTECSALQEKKDRLTEEVTRRKLVNEQLERLAAAKQTLSELAEREEEYDGMRARLLRGQAAERLKGAVQRKELAGVYLEKNRKQEQSVRKMLAQQEQEQAALAFFALRGQEIQAYMTLVRRRAELEAQVAAEEKQRELAAADWEQAKQHFLKAEQEKNEKQAAYEHADQKYRYAVVGVAARMLKPGKPCPVCGSEVHPDPAKEEPGLPSETELAALRGAWEQAAHRETEAQALAAEKRALAEAAEKRAAESRENGQVLKMQVQCAGEALAEAAEGLLSPAFFEKTQEEQLSFLQDKERRLEQLSALLDAGREQLDRLKKEQLSCEQEWEESRTALEEGLLREGFFTEAACREAVLTEEDRSGLEQQLAYFTERKNAAEGVRAHLESILSVREKYDLSQLAGEQELLRVELAARQQAWKRAHAFSDAAERTKQLFGKKQAGIAEAEEAYGYVRDLDNLASGNNARRLVFEQYVLSDCFDRILTAANLRLYRMSGSRYEMFRVEEAGDGRVKDSLEIEVKDYYTGKTRSVKTLSGGECFKAALSLALGMSDVIQAENGGIQVDALFIDEGFGALDQESLDQACEVLTGLVKSDRMIGIISHVAELRERIDSQLIIEKTNSGSSVKIRV